jgi:hypothetical protein
MSPFFFQQLLGQALAGIEDTSILATVIGIAYAILLVGFLVGLYQAAMRGGDLQMLAVTAIKYLVVAIILANWSTVFREVNGAFNGVAQSIANGSGAGDMFNRWMDQLLQQFETTGNQSLWDLITGTQAGGIAAEFVLIAYAVYACALVVFSFFYTLYGAVLFVLGPLVLALLPMAGIGQLARTYATNVMIWNAWGLLYAIFCALITAVHAGDVSAVMAQQGFLGFFHGLSSTALLGLISVFYAIALALIPLIAKRFIAGDVGAGAMSLVRAGVFVASNVVGAVSGFAAGMGGSTAGATGASGGSQIVMAGAKSGTLSTGAATQGAMSSSMPPPVPPPRSTSGGAMAAVMMMSTRGGGYRPRGVAQTVGYHAGRAMKGAVGSGSDDDA